MKIDVGFDLQPDSDVDGVDGETCPAKPEREFWERLGFAFGKDAASPWVMSDLGYPCIYGFENLDAVYLRAVPDTPLGRKFKALHEYYSTCKEKISKRQSTAVTAGMTQLVSAYKAELEKELKKYEEENWALGAVIQKELDALNTSGISVAVNKDLPESVQKIREEYMGRMAEIKADSVKWEDARQLLLETYAEDLTSLQKECLYARDMQLASMIEYELKKL